MTFKRWLSVAYISVVRLHILQTNDIDVLSRNVIKLSDHKKECERHY